MLITFSRRIRINWYNYLDCAATTIQIDQCYCFISLPAFKWSIFCNKLLQQILVKGTIICDINIRIYHCNLLSPTMSKQDLSVFKMIHNRFATTNYHQFIRFRSFSVSVAQTQILMCHRKRLADEKTSCTRWCARAQGSFQLRQRAAGCFYLPHIVGYRFMHIN